MGNDNTSKDRIQTPSIITVIMVAMTIILCCAIVTALALWPKGESIFTRDSEPTIFVLPTFTQPPIGPTQEANLPATQAPGVTAGPTLDRSTALPSTTPEPSSTFPLTETPTPSNTPPPTLTYTPTATFTRLPFDYILRDNRVAFSSSKTWFPDEGCKFQAIAGVIYDMAGNHNTGLLIHVWRDGDIDTRVATGSATLFGASGWLAQVDDETNGRVYFVQLLNPSYEPVSEVIRVDFSNSCDANFAFLTFDKVQ